MRTVCLRPFLTSPRNDETKIVLQRSAAVLEPQLGCAEQQKTKCDRYLDLPTQSDAVARESKLTSSSPPDYLSDRCRARLQPSTQPSNPVSTHQTNRTAAAHSPHQTRHRPPDVSLVQLADTNSMYLHYPCSWPNDETHLTTNLRPNSLVATLADNCGVCVLRGSTPEDTKGHLMVT